jgi:hypothetical protein
MHQRGRCAEALNLIAKAQATLRPHNEALASYDRALALKPDRSAPGALRSRRGNPHAPFHAATF